MSLLPASTIWNPSFDSPSALPITLGNETSWSKGEQTFGGTQIHKMWPCMLMGALSCSNTRKPKGATAGVRAPCHRLPSEHRKVINPSLDKILSLFLSQIHPHLQFSHLFLLCRPHPAVTTMWPSARLSTTSSLPFQSKPSSLGIFTGRRRDRMGELLSRCSFRWQFILPRASGEIKHSAKVYARTLTID